MLENQEPLVELFRLKRRRLVIPGHKGEENEMKVCAKVLKHTWEK
jgi:hypothetical protein